MDIEDIQRWILNGRSVVSFTHTEKIRRRKISLEMIEEAVHHGEIIEDYPDDPRGPSCLVFGITPSGTAASCGLWKDRGRSTPGDYGL